MLKVDITPNMISTEEKGISYFISINVVFHKVGIVHSDRNARQKANLIK